jgi:hypothetical protein
MAGRAPESETPAEAPESDLPPSELNASGQPRIPTEPPETPSANGSPRAEAEQVYVNSPSNPGGPATQLPPAASTQFTPTGATGETAVQQEGILGVSLIPLRGVEGRVPPWGRGC